MNKKLVGVKDRTFITMVKCMDGRDFEPFAEYADQFAEEVLGDEYSKKNIAFDTITAAGVIRFLATDEKQLSERDKVIRQFILEEIGISLHHHNSKGLVYGAHSDCAGNSISDDEQIEQVDKIGSMLTKMFPGYKKNISGIFVHDNSKVEEIFRG